jgi:hypothetical protein
MQGRALSSLNYVEREVFVKEEEDGGATRRKCMDHAFATMSFFVDMLVDLAEEPANIH